MNLETLELSPEEAKDRLADYEKLIGDERTAEDIAIAAGYRAAARGLPVIQLTNTIQAGGFFENGLPRLAIVRADATTCWARWSWQQQDALVFADNDRQQDRGALVGQHHVTVPGIKRPSGRAWGAHTIVPIIPPQHRPRRRRIRGFHILWEVEEWTMVPPKDPALVRHIRGDLWSVVAVWDLTDLERAVLSQRRSAT